KVLDLTDELTRTKTIQQTKIDGLERRVKKLEKKKRSRTHKLKRLYKVGLIARVISSSDDEALDKEDTSKQEKINEIDANEDIVLVSTHDDVSTTAIANILVSAAETIVTIALTITAQRLHEEEKLQLTDAEKAKLFIEFMDKRRKFFATKRDKEKRNKPPTKAQQRNIMTELVVEGSKKDEVTKDDGDNVTIDATPLSSKSSSIVDYKMYKEGKKNYFQIFRADESKVETDEEVEEILKDEEEEEEDEDDEYFNSFPTMEELTHHEWLLKNPRPPWVKERIRAGSLNNIKISCMIGHFFKIYAYIDLESPINVMSRHQYNQIMTYGLESRQKPSNLNKISNYVRRVRSLKNFIRSFDYECDFMICKIPLALLIATLEKWLLEGPS
nr:protein kinase-like domain, concanavalin A-like lectin/glucanase domain protein [Tanacetum cinerariifolium]